MCGVLIQSIKILYDYFYIFQELKRVTICFVIYFPIYFVIHFALTVAILHGPPIYTYRWLWSASTFADTTVLTIIVLVSTKWVLGKLKRFVIPKELEIRKTQKKRDIHTSLIDSLAASDDFKFNESVQFKKLLMDSASFDLYKRYLSKELSIEFLLAFIEIIQLQQFIVNQNAIYANEEFLYEDIMFHDNMIQSDIVHGTYENEEKRDELEMIRIKSNALYQKYIEYGSKYEIMLTNETHNKITDVMSHIDWIEDEDIDTNTILALWNDVSKELFSLLLDAFYRFQKTRHHMNLQDSSPQIISTPAKYDTISNYKSIVIPITILCRDNNYSDQFNFTIPYKNDITSRYSLGKLITDIITNLEAKHKPLRFEPIKIMSNSFMNHDIDYNEFTNTYSAISITDHKIDLVEKRGICLKIDIAIYEHKILNDSICKDVKNGKCLCTIYNQVAYDNIYTEKHLDHLCEYTHIYTECKFGDQCDAFKRLQQGGNSLKDRCHVTLFTHPPRNRKINIDNGINSFCLNDEWHQNISLYRPTDIDK
eukprot:403982_1